MTWNPLLALASANMPFKIVFLSSVLGQEDGEPI